MRAGARLLLVDDDAMLARVWRRHLERAGHVVTHQDTLEGARHLLATQPFDVVLLDLRLPDGDGALLARELRIARSDIAVVIASGVYDARRALELCDLCVVALPKPVSGHEMCRAVDRALAEREALCATVARFAATHGLSRTETEVVLAIATGLDAAGQSARVGCARGTLATYWHRILKKSCLHSQTAVLAALLRDARPGLERAFGLEDVPYAEDDPIDEDAPPTPSAGGLIPAPTATPTPPAGLIAGPTGIPGPPAALIAGPTGIPGPPAGLIAGPTGIPGPPAGLIAGPTGIPGPPARSAPLTKAPREDMPAPKSERPTATSGVFMTDGIVVDPNPDPATAVGRAAGVRTPKT